MRAVLIGAVEGTRVAAHCLAQAPNWELAGLVTLPSEVADRHSDFVDLAPVAQAAGARLIHAANGNADETIEAIAALEPDYLFVIGWSQLCGERLLGLTPDRVVGYHPAALPRLRGRGVIPWTILLGEPITAGTLFLIDEGTDTGAILAQRFFHVAPGETAASLYARHMAELAAMLPPLLADLAAGRAVPQEQDARCATHAARRRPDDGEIDWTGSAAAAWRMVRACGDPYPGARTHWNGECLVIAHAEPLTLADHDAALPGQVVARDDEGFIVRCRPGEGLRVREWRWSRPKPPPLHARLGPPR